MITISVAMIVKNEEEVLARCLNCVKQFADEIIIVDTGSSDRSKDIAKLYTDKVYDFIWCDDFSKARNYSFSKATMDYCMWIDADDVVLDEDIEKIKQLKTTLDPLTSIVMLKYHTAFDEEGNPTFTYYRERIVKREELHLWEGEIHEVIPLTGRLLYQDIAITHRKIKNTDSNRNLHIFEMMLKKGKQLGPREQFYYARELYYHERYEDTIIALERFLRDGKGWVENNIDACEILGYCYRQCGQEEKALESYLKSLCYDIPRGELCCDIAKHFFNRDDYEKAVFWYELALQVPKKETSGAFIREDCYGYIPAIQLCVCYFHLGNVEKAKAYNEMAASYKPHSKEVQFNHEFFNKDKPATTL